MTKPKPLICSVCGKPIESKPPPSPPLRIRKASEEGASEIGQALKTSVDEAVKSENKKRELLEPTEASPPTEPQAEGKKRNLRYHNLLSEVAKLLDTSIPAILHASENEKRLKEAEGLLDACLARLEDNDEAQLIHSKIHAFLAPPPTESTEGVKP